VSDLPRITRADDIEQLAPILRLTLAQFKSAAAVKSVETRQ
jgi:hypothetical protein